MGKTNYSVVVTTLNNEQTLAQCLRSVPGASELLVLDSGSTDGTQAIAEQFNARWVQQAFRGYGPQKQDAVNLAGYDWVLLLDADEALSSELAVEIDVLMESEPEKKAYRLPRCEQLFWRWQSRSTKYIHAVRLFNRQYAQLGQGAVHAGVETQAAVAQLTNPILHRAETDLHSKVARINHYSSGMVRERMSAPVRFLKLRIVLYPTIAFWREYLIRRQCFNGWAGYLAARSSAFYAFLKYAKLLDASKSRPDDLLDTRDQNYRSP